jgi:hypothetical protein
MKPYKNYIPGWFNINNYLRVQSWEAWAYEVWVRANYYRAFSADTDRAFVTHSMNDPSYRGRCLHLRAIPVCVEYYQNFLNDSTIFWESFCEIKRFWWADGEGDAIHVHKFEDSLPAAFISDLPQMVEKDVVLELFEDWFLEHQPISLNFGCSTKKINDAIEICVKQQREMHGELLHATGIVDSIGKWGSNYIWKGAKLLALFDLLYWRATHPGLTYPEIGAAIWPDEDLEYIEQRVKDVGIPLMKQFFSERTAKALYLEHVALEEEELRKLVLLPTPER